MKRLLRFVTFLMITVTFLMPLLECFDRWDRPGLSNDTEFPIFLLTLFLSLVLLAVAAMARRVMDQQNERIETEIVYETLWTEFQSWTDISVSPAISPPLRI